MDSPTFAFVALNLLFATLFVACARLLLGRRGSPVLWTYAIVTVAFVYLLPDQEYSLDVGLEVLLLAHLLMFVYLLTVLLVARRHAGTANGLRACAVAVPSYVIVGIFVSWLAFRVYLITAYGPAALMFSRAQVVQSSGLVEFSTWEVALSSLTTMLLLGALAVVVIQRAADETVGSPFITAAAIVMTALVVVTNESPIGSRRLLLVLGAMWLSVTWCRSGIPLWRWIKRHVGRVLLVTVAVSGLAFWYQLVRNNDFTEILTAREPSDIVAATINFATTFEALPHGEDIQVLRSGPFDFFAKVVDVSAVRGTSSNGEATALSLALAVPKVLYPGQKPIGDVDDVLFERLAIYPSTPFVSIDYSTSLPAIGVADFGPLGAIAAAIFLGVCFVIVGQLLRLVKSMPLAPLLMLGLSIQVIGSQEAGLTAIVSSLRDTALALCALTIGRLLFALFFWPSPKSRCSAPDSKTSSVRLAPGEMG